MRDAGKAQSYYLCFGEARQKLWVLFIWNDGIMRDVTANVTSPTLAGDKESATAPGKEYAL